MHEGNEAGFIDKVDTVVATTCGLFFDAAVALGIFSLMIGAKCLKGSARAERTSRTSATPIWICELTLGQGTGYCEVRSMRRWSSRRGRLCVGDPAQGLERH